MPSARCASPQKVNTHSNLTQLTLSLFKLGFLLCFRLWVGFVCFFFVQAPTCWVEVLNLFSSSGNTRKTSATSCPVWELPSRTSLSRQMGRCSAARTATTVSRYLHERYSQLENPLTHRITYHFHSTLLALYCFFSSVFNWSSSAHKLTITNWISLVILEITIIQSCVKVSAIIQGLVKGAYSSTHTDHKPV